MEIECNKTNNAYYIVNQHVLVDDSLQNWLLSLLTIRGLVGDSAALNGRILFEPVPSANEKLAIALQAMKENLKLRLHYLRYGSCETKVYDVEPYCVKLSNRRWYALVRFQRGDLFVVSIDRMQSIEMTSEHFSLDPNFDAEAFFADCYGVITDDGYEAEKIVIRIFGKLKYYIVDAPLHHSQRLSHETDEYADFELFVRPSVDFCRLLLGFCNDIEVLAPKWLARKVCRLHGLAASLYLPEEQ